jgi:hypothetical protein
MGQWSGLWTESAGEIGSRRPISDLGLRRSVKESLDEFLSSGGLVVCETTVGVVYGHEEIGLHTNSVRTLGSAREER